MKEKVIFRFSTLKAILIGVISSLIMLFGMYAIIGFEGISPVKASPIVIFLSDLNIPAQPLATILHIGYGTFWALLLVSIFKKRTNIKKALTMSFLLWSSLMLVFSPLVGWGFFGLSGNAISTPYTLSYIQPGIGFAALTFFAHLIYGALIGILLPKYAVYDRPVMKDRNKYHTLKQKRISEQH